jgi:hypothetical protein
VAFDEAKGFIERFRGEIFKWGWDHGFSPILFRKTCGAPGAKAPFPSPTFCRG